VEAAFHSIGQALDGTCLGQTRSAFYQQVAICEQSYDESLYQVGLANYLPDEPFFQGSNVCACHAFSCFCRCVSGSAVASGIHPADGAKEVRIVANLPGTSSAHVRAE
jgi:hypothetical protein